MPVYQLILLFLFMVFVQPVAALSNEDILPPEQAFKLKVIGQSREQVDLEWQIEEGYHLYREKVLVQSQTDD